jgi:hypothetical protein
MHKRNDIFDMPPLHIDYKLAQIYISLYDYEDDLFDIFQSNELFSHSYKK